MRRWIVFAGAIAILLIIGFVALDLAIRQNFPPDDPLGCLGNDRDNLSPTKLSEKLGIPLVVVDPLPVGIVDEPQIRVHVEYPIESPVCGIRVRYFNIISPRPEIEILVFKARITGGTDEWSCLDYPEYPRPIEGEPKSVCSATLDSVAGRVFIRVSTQQFSDVTLSLARRIKFADTQ